jgi:hypothetical protein
LANSSPIAQIFLKKGKPGDSRLGREFFEADVGEGVPHIIIFSGKPYEWIPLSLPKFRVFQ